MHVQKEFAAIRSRSVLKILRGLNINIATGQDGIRARILKGLSDVLAYPIAVLSRRILYEGCWPNRWRSHLLIPIYKKRSVYSAINYRGIHLTTILSKVVGRTIGNPLISHLQSHGFGDHQWVFRKMSGARDLLTVCVSPWNLAFCKGCKVGWYLSDITAAFDKVFKDFLMAKLVSAGVADVFLDFLNSYLARQIGRVAIGGVLSDLVALDDMVFQGTVIGPVLWNTFFSSVTDAAVWHDGTPEIFADDLAVYKCYDKNDDSQTVKENLRRTRLKIHNWGRQHRVEFDNTKEHVAILHPAVGVGEDFKYLGCLIDCYLRMSAAVDHIVSWARPKIKELLRTRGIYDCETMLQQYKTHIWGGTEYANGAILHACDTVLQAGSSSAIILSQDASHLRSGMSGLQLCSSNLMPRYWNTKCYPQKGSRSLPSWN